MAPPPCANPLFLKWVEELRDDARQKGLKTATMYAKGCRSLAACPIVYSRPRDLIQLQGIGPKTVNILEKRLKAHCEQTGEPYPTSPPRPGSARPSEPEEDTTPENDRPPPKKKRAAAPKVYIPQKGSGAYGILIGLLLQVDDPDDTIQVFLTKAEIIRVAQPFCDSSYEHPERGGYQTAWNGIKTLINKGYVFVSGSPHKYCLTEEGYDVAVTLRNMHPDFEDEPKMLPLARNAEPSLSDLLAAESGAAPARPSRVGSLAKSRSGASSVTPSNKFGFWYIDTTSSRVRDRSSARQRLDPDDFITLRQIEFRKSQKDHPIVSQLKFIEEGSSDQTLFAYMVDEGAPPTCSTFEDSSPAPSRTFSRTPSLTDRAPAGPPVPTNAPRAFSRTPSINDRTSKGPQILVDPPPPLPAPRSEPSRAQVVRGSGEAAGRSRPRLSAHMPMAGDDCVTPSVSLKDTITVPHGSYEVVLVLDSREIESKSSRDNIADKLAAKGILVETRALRLGDMCWIARRLDPRGDEGDECVLDYVIERKRLDDLCSSIRDGRYNEQCYRLQRSGVGNVFYIVEDWQVAERMEFNGKQIQTAKSQVQVVSGFFLKETHKLNDTIDFLVTMTNVVSGLVRDLHVIPSRFVSRTSYAALQRRLREEHPGKAFLSSFEVYQSLNDKSAARTVYEGLGRMLLCVKGMSPEKVSAILDCWDTPRALYEAMVSRHSQGPVEAGRKTRGPELMFADEVPGEGRRKIGDVLSKALWTALWGQD